jgi:carbon-monoxide dehydrogenase medium subunit
MLKPFRLHEPTTVEETVAVLGERGDTAKLYAGGTELLLAMKTGLLHYDDLVNVKTVAGLDTIALEDDALIIGAAVTHAAIERSALVRDAFLLIAQVEHTVANVRVRNVGTLAGNLCFAEPHSDPGTLLLIYDAEVEVAGPSGRRTVALADLQAGPYETSLAQDEVLTSIRVPPLPDGTSAVYRKFGYHHRPTLGVACALRADGGVIVDARIAVGSVSPAPLRVPAAEAVVIGERAETLASNTNEQATALTEAGRIAAAASDAFDDLHGSAEYKEHLVEVFVARALAEAARGMA